MTISLLADDGVTVLGTASLPEKTTAVLVSYFSGSPSAMLAGMLGGLNVVIADAVAAYPPPDVQAANAAVASAQAAQDSTSRSYVAAQIPPTLVSIVVTPTNPTVTSGTQQFVATGTYSDTSSQDLLGQVTWSSGTPAVATIASGGLATIVAASGSAVITATLGAIQGSTTLTV